MARFYNFFINADAVVASLKGKVEEVTADLKQGTERLAIMTHAKVIEMANEDLKGYQRETFLGENGGNIRWARASENVWMVEVDESVMWLNDGREPKDMATDDWLLKNAKTSKAGHKYKVIPFTHDVKGKAKNENTQQQVLNAMAKGFIQKARTQDGKKISTKTIERNADGSPKLGILHKIPAKAPLEQHQAPTLFSKPRGAQEAQATGLKEHGGIFKLQGMAVSQRMVGAKVKREAVTFRVVSSKHKGHRWIYPAVKRHDFLQRALDWAMNQGWPDILRDIKAKHFT